MKTATILAAAMGLAFGAEDKKPLVAPVIKAEVQLRVANAQLEKANIESQRRVLSDRETRLAQEFTNVLADLNQICGSKFHVEQPQSFGGIGVAPVVCVANPEPPKTEKK